MEDREFDLLLWGATGFTGVLVAQYLVDTYGVAGDLKWALAGRNADKLHQVARQIAGSDAEQIPLVIADSNDSDSIEAMVQRARVICSTVGPYAKYGTTLVEACARSGTHCCDLTGEVPWMRDMIDNYQSLAESSGARIVHTCGFDSIPSDLGVYYLQEQMQARHGNYASEVKFRVAGSRGGVSGGTVDSMMNMMDEASRDPSLRDLLADPYALNPQNMPRGDDPQDQTSAVYDPDLKEWTAPFMMAGINTRVVRRSNALLDYRYGRDFRYSEAMLTGAGPGGYIAASAIAGASLVGVMLAAFGGTRSLLKTFVPKPGEGPSPETIEQGFFRIKLFGRHPSDSSKNLLVEVTGDRDPGYGATSKMLAEAAVCLAKDELDCGGGVWTPASALGDKLLTRLIEKAGMTFGVLE